MNLQIHQTLTDGGGACVGLSIGLILITAGSCWMMIADGEVLENNGKLIALLSESLPW